MFTFAVVFILKFLDCALSTLKTVLLYKEKYLYSSICNSASALFFIFVADMMANSVGNDKFVIAIMVFLANFIGSYIPPKIMDSLESEQLYVYNVTCDTFDNGIIFADTLRELNVPISTETVYDTSLNKTLFCRVYAKNKMESKIIKENILLNKAKGNNFKYHIVTGMQF